MNIYNRMLALLGIALLLNFPMQAQDDASDAGPKFIIVTTFHWNPDADVSFDEWKALQKEFRDKVISKNDLILSSDIYTHFFTADNSEVKFVSTYGSWADIEAAGAKNGELIRAAWPDEEARKAFFNKMNAIFTDEHADEIYSPAPGAKQRTADFDKEIVLYMRTSKFAFPEDGSNDEFKSLMKEMNDTMIQPNEYIQGYYPNYHAYGADRRDFVEAFVCNSLADVEKSFEKSEELAKAKWPDEAKRKEFFKKMNKYFTGSHGDYLYKNIPELSK